eukprot:Nk52_evm71s215 gene=Nk52_evmTU71s215
MPSAPMDVDTKNVNLDNKSEVSFVNFYHAMPKKPSTTFQFFNRGDYYTVHGEDALMMAKDFFHTMGVVKYVAFGKKELPYVVVNRMMYESSLRELLLLRQYRVEVYAKVGMSSSWKLSLKGSPGNLQEFEESLFNTADISTSAVVMAVYIGNDNGQRAVGVAYGDATMRKIGLVEFVDNDQFGNLEALVVQLAARECLLSTDNSPDAEKVRKIVERCGILITNMKRSDFNSSNVVQDLERILKTKTAVSALPEVDLRHAICSVAAIIKYLDLLADSTNFKQFTLAPVDLSQYMKIDSSASKALNLFPTSSNNQVKTMSLFGLLNQCCTAQGKRLLHQWIKQPLLDVNKIKERHDLVESLVECIEIRQILQEEHLKRIPDVFRVCKKFSRKKASLQDCVRVYDVIERLPRILAALEAYEGKHNAMFKECFVDPLKSSVTDCQKFKELVETTIDLDKVANHEYVIKPSFDEELKEIREKMDACIEKIPSLLNTAARDLSLEAHKSIKLENNSQMGYFFRVTRKDEKVLRKQSSYFTIDTQKNGVRFTNSKLKAINTEYQSLKEQYDTVQSGLATEIINICSGYCEPLEMLNDVLAFLDVLTSFASVSSNAPTPYVRPNLTPMGEGDLKLLGARHPCLEVQDDVSFIANDVRMERDKSSLQIITGPNMGGKSTYIRQAGVIVLLAQIGCFVPCVSASISVVDSILARVGAGDSQLKGVSTFMAEMLETASILKQATKNSLIIIDELGRGTSTYDGFGLAWAISEYIAKKIHAFTFFASHFHELTVLGKHLECVKNIHVSALTSDSKLTLLYRVKDGPCDQSFGIHVAELAKFPDSVVQVAKRKAAELEDFENITEKKSKTGGEGDCGETAIRTFLSEVSQLSRKAEDSERSFMKLQELRARLEKTDSPHIQTFLQSIL